MVLYEVLNTAHEQTASAHAYTERHTDIYTDTHVLVHIQLPSRSLYSLNEQSLCTSVTSKEASVDYFCPLLTMNESAAALSVSEDGFKYSVH